MEFQNVYEETTSVTIGSNAKALTIFHDPPNILAVAKTINLYTH